MRTISLFLLSTSLVACGSDSSTPSPMDMGTKMPPQGFHGTGTIEFTAISESSGVVRSRNYPEVFWTHNDSGDRPLLYAMKRAGGHIYPPQSSNYQGLEILGARNRDWEDISIDDQGQLVIADFGNNANKREDLGIYLIDEPDPTKVESAQVKAHYLYYYPDQQELGKNPRNFDSEAFFFAQGQYYLLTKHRSDDHTKLYRLDSFNEAKAEPLTLLGEFDIDGQVTAAEASTDGSLLAVLTYGAIWVFKRPKDSDNYLEGDIDRIEISAGQAEAICFIDDERLLVTNEQRQLYEIDVAALIPLRRKR